MSVLYTLPLLWSQAGPAGMSRRWNSTLQWLYVWGEPSATVSGLPGAFLTWFKVAGLFCLLGWIAGWVIAAIKGRTVARTRWLDVAALVAMVGAALSALLNVLQSTQRIPI